MWMQIFKILSPGLFSTFCDMLSFNSEYFLVLHPTAFIHVRLPSLFHLYKIFFFLVCDILFGMIEYT